MVKAAMAKVIVAGVFAAAGAAQATPGEAEEVRGAYVTGEAHSAYAVHGRQASEVDAREPHGAESVGTPVGTIAGAGAGEVAGAFEEEPQIDD